MTIMTIIRNMRMQLSYFRHNFGGSFFDNALSFGCFCHLISIVPIKCCFHFRQCFVLFGPSKNGRIVMITMDAFKWQIKYCNTLEKIKKIICNVFSTLHFRSITSYRQWCQIRYHSKMYLQIQNIRYISYEYDKLSHIIVPKHIIFSSEMLTSKPLTATGIHTAGQKSTSAFNTSAIMYL